MTTQTIESAVWETPGPGSWQLESAHFPTPITRYHASILRTQFPRGFKEGSARLGTMLSHFDHAVVNGFDYISPRIVGAPAKATGTPPYPIFKLVTWLHPAVRHRLETQRTVFERRPWREDVDLWETRYRPESTATHLRLQEFDVASASDAELADHLVALRANAEHQYYLHHRFTLSALVPVGDYLARTAEWTGLPLADLVQACRQPRGIATVAQDRFDAVVAALRGEPAALAQDGHAEELLAALATRSGELGDAVRAWLTMASHRLVTGYDIIDLTAGEMPELLIRTLRAALDDRADDREQRHVEHAARVRDAVPVAARNDYDAALAEALSVSNLREERALVCDFWAYGLVRRAVHEAGRRVAHRGRIADPSHLFDADHDEMLTLLRGAGGPDTKELVERHAWRTTVTSAIAPGTLGPAPAEPPPPEWFPPATRRLNIAVDTAVRALFDEPEPRTESKLVCGLAASVGTYEGRARVVLCPADFGRIEQGDVLVARMTTEAYNGLLPLLGAVVTDRDGLLCHSATVAREFGIPAVVGSGTATQVIPDGARVLVDGTRGEVRLT